MPSPCSSTTCPAATGSPCDTCGSTLQWEYDRAAGGEAFGCPRRYAQPRPAPLPVSVAIRPEQPHEALSAGTAQPGPIAPAMPENAGTLLAQQREAATATAALEPPAAQPARPQLSNAPISAARGCELPSGTWYDRGPPLHRVQSATNSCLYVPILHAALGALSSHALAQWRAEPPAPHWEDMRRALAIAAPVPIATLTEALIAAFTHRGEPLPAAALAEAAVLPSHTLVHLGWVVRNLAHADGYVSAAGQEACFTIYGGHAIATGLDRLSDAFRQASVPAAPTAPPIGRRLTVTYGDLSADEVRLAPEASSEQQDGSGQHNDEAAEHAVTTANAPPTVERAESEVKPLEVSAWDAAPTVGSPSPAWPRSSLAWLAAVNLSAEFRERLPTLRSVPRFLTAGVRRCLTRPAGGNAATRCSIPRGRLEAFLVGAALAPSPMPRHRPRWTCHTPTPRRAL